MQVTLGSYGSIRTHRVEVASLQQASQMCRRFIVENGLGSSVWMGGNVYDNNRKVATVSYNGRVWDLNGNEIVVK